jgi:hypothetical protein
MRDDTAPGPSTKASAPRRCRRARPTRARRCAELSGTAHALCLFERWKKGLTTKSA